MISINRQAAMIVQEMLNNREALGIGVSSLSNGTTVIDAGVLVSASLSAGQLFAEACLGGLGHVDFTRLTFDDLRGSFSFPGVNVTVNQPLIACMASQLAGWPVKRGHFFAMGSGPARSLHRGEELYNKFDYVDDADLAVLLLEGRTLPDEQVASFVAEECAVPANRATLLVAPSASLVGSVQIAARIVETALHKLDKLGFDVRQVVAGFGVCPIAPVASDDGHAIGRTNDAVLYGGQAFLTVRADDAEIATLIDRVPSSASSDYGIPFYNLFRKSNWDLYAIDPLLFSPAQVYINNLTSGRTFGAGQINPSLLRASLLEN